MSELYERIEKLCGEKGVSITTMCRESGASRGSLTDLKKGRIQSLSADTLAKLAEYFSVSVDQLLGSDPGERPVIEGARQVSREDIMFALSRGNEKAITEEMYEEILSFADYVIQREENKKRAGTGFPF